MLGKVLTSTLMALALIATFTGCASRAPIKHYELSTELKHGEEKILGGDDWGIALSGGGLRSALYSMGVMKALYDQGALQHIKVISSASGGSYAALWLVEEQMKNLGKPLGESILSDDKFRRSVCELIGTGNFVTNFEYLDAAFSWHPSRASIEMYEASLRRSFGRNPAERTIDQLANATLVKQVPYWIVNTAIHKPDPEHRLHHGVFEFTPLVTGNQSRGYWRANTGKPVPVVKAVAISGAALAPFLAQPFEVPSPTGTNEYLELSDGGHVENLAAFALIRRKVKNIIIVDAEMDRYYGFAAYRKLKKGLVAYGVNLTVGEADQATKFQWTPWRLKQSVMTGTATHPDGSVSTIVYLKLGLPDSILPLMTVGNMPQAKGGVSQDGSCYTLPNDGQTSTTELLRVRMANYADFRSAFGDFPHFHTVDQSYYTDQTSATLGLGYFQGCDLHDNSDFKDKIGAAACKPPAGRRR